MSRDTLSDVHGAVRLRGAVFYYIEGASPWVAEAPPAREMIPAIMPAAEHLMEFHGIVKGSCWAAIVGEAPIRLMRYRLGAAPWESPSRHDMSGSQDTPCSRR